MIWEFFVAGTGGWGGVYCTGVCAHVCKGHGLATQDHGSTSLLPTTAGFPAPPPIEITRADTFRRASPSPQNSHGKSPSSQGEPKEKNMAVVGQWQQAMWKQLLQKKDTQLTTVLKREEIHVFKLREQVKLLA